MRDLSSARGNGNDEDMVCLTGVVSAPSAAPDAPRPQGVNIVNCCFEKPTKWCQVTSLRVCYTCCTSKSARKTVLEPTSGLLVTVLGFWGVS
jgi:hypothetical protein